MGALPVPMIFTAAPPVGVDMPRQQAAWPVVAAFTHPFAPAGAHTYHALSAEPQEARTGGEPYSWRHDWYFRTHIIPDPLSLGNLVSAQVREIYVWNAWFEVRTLDAFAESGTDGIDITLPGELPATWGTLQARIVEANVSLDGPAVIDGSLTFTFDNETRFVPITGARVLGWPWSVNWVDPVGDAYQWYTEINMSKDGTEQRMRMREFPRRRLAMSHLLQKKERRRMEALLWGWQQRSFAVPLWQDAGQLNVSALAGDVTLSTDTAGRDYQPDTLVFVRTDSEAFEINEIESVGSGVLNLARPMENDWPAGTRVFPARVARIEREQALDRDTADLLSMRCQWLVQGNVGAPGWSGAEYRGHPIMPQRHNWRLAWRDRHVRYLDQSDSMVRDALTEDRVGSPVVYATQEYLARDRAEAAELREFLHHVAGAWRPFWVETRRPDIKMLSTIGNTAEVMQVENTGYASLYAVDRSRRDIRIWDMRSGDVWYRRIVAATEIDDDIETLQIDTPITETLQPEDAHISYLIPVRLDGDRADFTWLTAGIMEARIQVRSVLDDI